MKTVAFALLLFASTVHAQARPLFYGDSMFGCGAGSAACPNAPAGTAIAHYFKTALSLPTFCQNAVDSRHACTALSQAAFNIAFCDLGGETTDIYIEFGTNGQFSLTPEQNADCILGIADLAEGLGVRPHILLPPLVGPSTPFNPQRRQFTNETVFWLYENNVNSHEFIPDILTTLPVCSSDEVHPTVQACRQAMGTRLAAWQP